MPRIAFVSPRFERRDGRVLAAEADVRAIFAECVRFRSDRDRWPRSVLDALDPGPEPGSGVAMVCFSPDLELDPWGGRYHLLVDGEEDQLFVVSFGADERPGGRGLDADIIFGGDQPYR